MLRIVYYKYMKKAGIIILTAAALLAAGSLFAAQSENKKVDINVIVTPAVSSPQISNPNESIYTINTPTINGQAEPGAIVIIYNSQTNEEIGRVTADQNCLWPFTFPPLAQGQFTISTVAVDQSGHESEHSPTFTFYYEPVTSPTFYSRSLIVGARRAIASVITFTPAIIQSTTIIARVTQAPLALLSTLFIALPFFTGSLATLGFVDLITYILFPINSFLESIGLRKKRTPWGVVYNSKTKLPLPQTIVRLFNVTTNKLMETRVTDRNGRYGFLAEPGKYVIRATKATFNFPTTAIKEKNDPPYTDIYRGQTLSVVKGSITVNIPIDPPGEPYEIKSEFAKQALHLISKTRVPVLTLGSLLALWLLGNRRELTDLFIIGFYGLLWSNEIRLERTKPWGIVYNSQTKEALTNAVIQIFDQEYQRLLETKLTDEQGRFSILIKPGKYYLTVAKQGFSFPSKQVHGHKDKQYTKLYYGQTFEVKTEKETLVNFDIAIDPLIEIS